jgi:O-antigen ligase
MFYLLAGFAVLFIIISPSILIGINLLLVMVRPQEFMLGSGDSGIVMLMLGSAAIAWILGKRRDLSFPQITLITAFFLALPLSEIFSGNGGDMSTAFSEFFPAWLLFVVISSSLESLQQLQRFIYLLIICAVIIAFHSIEQYFNDVAWAGAEILIENGVRRVRYLGIFHDPNDLGILFVAALPLTLYCARESQGPVRKGVLLVAAIVILYALYLTKSRGALLSLGFVSMLAIWRHFNFIKASLISGFFALVGASLKIRSETIGGGDQSSLDRIDGWQLGMELFQSNPLFGVGYNHYIDFYFLTAHNSLVLVLAETGALGYVLWVSFFAILMILLFKSSLDGKQFNLMEEEPYEDLDAYQKMTWVFFLSLSGYLFGSFFLSQTYSIFLFLLAAFGTGAYLISFRHRNPDEKEALEGWDYLPMTLLFSFASILLLWLIINFLIRISY